jgi:hypothetical protein
LKKKTLKRTWRFAPTLGSRTLQGAQAKACGYLLFNIYYAPEAHQPLAENYETVNISEWSRALQ